MKYYITTLAIGDLYFTNSINFHKNLSAHTEHALFNITTTKQDIAQFEANNNISITEYLREYPKLEITTIDMFNDVFEIPIRNPLPVYFPFNVNLKVLSLKACVKSQKEFDYIIYMDADWNLHPKFSEDKIFEAFRRMNEGNFDFAFERPAQVGPYKTNPDCFFPQKIKDYNVLEHSLWDNAYVVNEQILLFANNWKFKLFAMKWEQFLWYSIANKIENYAEGFEIGVSALESHMNWSEWGVLIAMNECFNFYSKDGGFHVRF